MFYSLPPLSMMHEYWAQLTPPANSALQQPVPPEVPSFRCKPAQLGNVSQVNGPALALLRERDAGRQLPMAASPMLEAGRRERRIALSRRMQQQAAGPALCSSPVSAPAAVPELNIFQDVDLRARLRIRFPHPPR